MKTTITGLTPSNAIRLSLAGIVDTKDLFRDVKVEIKLAGGKILDKYKTGKFVDIRKGELLNLGVLSAYYNAASNRREKYLVLVGVEDVYKKECESLISDGGIRNIKDNQYMPIQQVLVQRYFNKANDLTTEIIKQIKEKETKRNDYPQICALLVAIYDNPGETIDVGKIIKECSLERYDAYFILGYEMPKADRCIVINLRKTASFSELEYETKVINYAKLQ